MTLSSRGAGLLLPALLLIAMGASAQGTGDAGAPVAAPGANDAGGAPTAATDAGGAPAGEAATADGGAAAPAAAGGQPPPPGSVNECRWGISKEMTERLGAVVAKEFPASQRCSYAGILTQRTVLDLNWNLDGKPQPPVRVSVRECMANPPEGSDRFVVQVPAELTTACPETAAFVDSFRKAVSNETPLEGDQKARQKRDRPYALLGLVVAVAIGLILWRRARDLKEGRGGGGNSSST